MTLTKFMARSTWVAHAFGWEKLLKCHMKGKASKKLANGQNIDYSEKRKWPKGFICPCTGVKYHNIQTCLLVYAADSGERLQDHWSSGNCPAIQGVKAMYDVSQREIFGTERKLSRTYDYRERITRRYSRSVAFVPDIS